MTNLTLGTAQITTHSNGAVSLRYMNTGSFLVGERTCISEQEAREFCRARGIRVLRCGA